MSALELHPLPSGRFARLLRESDNEDLQDMSDDIYDGDDYFCVEWRDWISNPSREVWTVVNSETGPIVAMQVMSVFDQGRTILYQALRTHRDHRGLGIATELKNWSSQRLLTCEKYKNVKRERSATVNFNVSKLEKEGKSILQHCSIRIVETGGHTTKNDVVQAIESTVERLFDRPVEDLPKVEVLRACEMWELFSALPLDEQELMVPGLTIMPDFVPLEMNKNMSDERDAHRWLFVAQKEPEGGKLRTFSVSVVSPRRVNVWLVVAFYGVRTAEELLSQLYMHAKHSDFKGNNTKIFLLPSIKQAEIVEKVAADLRTHFVVGGEGSPLVEEVTELVIINKDLPR